MLQPFLATDGALCRRSAAAALRSARNSSRWRTRLGGISLNTSSNMVSGSSEGPPVRVPYDSASFQQALTCASSSFSSRPWRSEEHTSELQSQSNLVCRLLLEK